MQILFATFNIRQMGANRNLTLLLRHIYAFQRTEPVVTEKGLIFINCRHGMIIAFAAIGVHVAPICAIFWNIYAP